MKSRPSAQEAFASSASVDFTNSESAARSSPFCAGNCVNISSRSDFHGMRSESFRQSGAERLCSSSTIMRSHWKSAGTFVFSPFAASSAAGGQR